MCVGGGVDLENFESTSGEAESCVERFTNFVQLRMPVWKFALTWKRETFSFPLYCHPDSFFFKFFFSSFLNYTCLSTLDYSYYSISSIVIFVTSV